MSSNTPHAMWPFYSEDIYLKTYHLSAIKNNSACNFLKIHVSAGEPIELCFTKLQWDSDHFGYPCYKLDMVSKHPTLTPGKEDLMHIRKEIDSFLNEKNIRFVFADIDSANSSLNRFIQDIGFRFILNWLDGFIETKNYIGAAEETEIKILSGTDIEFYAQLAKKEYYKGGRFYSDHHFDKEKVDELYAALVNNSTNDNNILMTETENGLQAGLMICKNIMQYEYTKPIRVAHLRFLVLNREIRGQGIGERLVRKTLNYLKDKCDIITSGIETHNLVSLNLHNKIGFKYNYSHNAYHYWHGNSKVNTLTD